MEEKDFLPKDNKRAFISKEKRWKGKEKEKKREKNISLQNNMRDFPTYHIVPNE